MTDANGRKSFYPLVQIDSIETPDNVFRFKNVPAMKLPEPSPLACFPIDGLIGSDLLAQSIVVIDGQKKTVIITTAEKESIVSLRKMARFMQARMPVISLQVGIRFRGIAIRLRL